MLKGLTAAFTLAALTACGGTASTPATPGPSATALPERCHVQSKALMTAALTTDGNFDKLPKLADRSMGIAACKGLTSEQLDKIALDLQTELQPLMLAAAASAAAKPS